MYLAPLNRLVIVVFVAGGQTYEFAEPQSLLLNGQEDCIEVFLRVLDGVSAWLREGSTLTSGSFSFRLWNHDCGGISVDGLYNLNGCEGVLKARASRGGLIMKSRVGYGEGVKPGLLNEVAGEAVTVNELRLIAVEFE